MFTKKLTTIAGFCLTAAIAFSAPSDLMAGHHKSSGDHDQKEKKEYKTSWNKDKKDIVDTAVEAGKFKTLATALEAAGLVETLKGEGPFTVFAPTDEAFAKIDKETLSSLLQPENKDKLTAILTYHVVAGKYKAEKVLNKEYLKTVQGSKASISLKDGMAMIDGAKIVKTDIKASNGVIHVIDSVIMPSADKAAKADIVDTAVAAGNFTTLAAAIKAADLVDTLKGDGPFTVFAPTDDAFAKLPEGTIETLLKPENKADLQNILLYHVVPGKMKAKDVLAKKELTAANDVEIPLESNSYGAKAAGAKIIKTDIMTSNGIIHVIDTVMIPEKKETAKAGY